jgi:two-component system sensor histidine kinase HydH
MMKKGQPFKRFRSRKLYLPAVTIVMVVITLVIMHAISTIRTLDRNRHQWESFLEKEGHDIISMVKSEIVIEKSSSSGRVREFLDALAGNPGIAYIGLLDRKREWRVWSQWAQSPHISMPGEDFLERGPGLRAYQAVKVLPDGRSILEVGEFLNANEIQGAVIGLWMTPLEEARNQDIRHAFLMGGILLILGSAAFYFIFVVQNYYLVDRTLLEMRSYTEKVVESMASGLITVDKSGNIVSHNRKASAMLDLGRQVRGHPLETVIPFRCLDLTDVLYHEREIIEKEIDCPRGEESLPLSVSATPLRDPEGLSMGAVIILRDLRQIRGLQEEVRRSERLASLGRLASGVAHEIRNPLSSIKGFAQYFRDKFEKDSQDRSYAELVIKEVERLNRVITQLLDFARPKELHLQSYPLSQVIEHPLRLIQGDLDKKGIRLRTTLLKEGVAADWDQITQALLNIFLNAMDSMDGTGELQVRTVLRPEKKGVEVSITDTGSGIPRENLSRIFDPFFSTKKKGTGLGLAITAKIIEAHQGEITVESEEGRGTTFKIVLPLPRS